MNKEQLFVKLREACKSSFPNLSRKESEKKASEIWKKMKKNSKDNDLPELVECQIHEWNKMQESLKKLEKQIPTIGSRKYEVKSFFKKILQEAETACFENIILFVGTEYKYFFKEFREEKVQVVFGDKLNAQTVGNFVKSNRRIDDKRCLYVIVTGLFSLVESEAFIMCQDCRVPLDFLKNPASLQMAKLMVDKANLMCTEIQMKVGRENIVAIVPPLPAIVAQVENYNKHKVLHVAAESHKIPVTDRETYIQILEVYHCFYESLTNLACERVSYWFHSPMFSKLRNKNYKSMSLGTIDINYMSLEIWLGALKDFCQTVLKTPFPLTVIPNPLQKSTEKIDYSDNLERFFRTHSTVISNTLQRSTEKDNHLDISQQILKDNSNSLESVFRNHSTVISNTLQESTEEDDHLGISQPIFKNVVVVANKACTEHLQALTKSLHVMHLDRTISLDEDGLAFICELQKTQPEKTLFVVVAGVSELAELQGSYKCLRSNCQESLLTFISKNHEFGDPNFKGMSNEEMVNTVIRKLFNFAEMASSLLEDYNAIFLTPIIPVQGFWAENFKQDVLHELHKEDAFIPHFRGVARDWINSAKLLESKWLEELMKSFDKSSIPYELLTVYNKEKPPVLKHIPSILPSGRSTALRGTWSVLMANLIRHFLGMSRSGEPLPELFAKGVDAMDMADLGLHVGSPSIASTEEQSQRIPDSSLVRYPVPSPAVYPELHVSNSSGFMYSIPQGSPVSLGSSMPLKPPIPQSFPTAQNLPMHSECPLSQNPPMPTGTKMSQCPSMLPGSLIPPRPSIFLGTSLSQSPSMSQGPSLPLGPSISQGPPMLLGSLMPQSFPPKPLITNGPPPRPVMPPVPPPRPVMPPVTPPRPVMPPVPPPKPVMPPVPPPRPVMPPVPPPRPVIPQGPSPRLLMPQGSPPRPVMPQGPPPRPLMTQCPPLPRRPPIPPGPQMSQDPPMPSRPSIPQGSLIPPGPSVSQGLPIPPGSSVLSRSLIPQSLPRLLISQGPPMIPGPSVPWDPPMLPGPLVPQGPPMPQGPPIIPGPSVHQRSLMSQGYPMPSSSGMIQKLPMRENSSMKTTSPEDIPGLPAIPVNPMQENSKSNADIKGHMVIKNVTADINKDQAMWLLEKFGKLGDLRMPRTAAKNIAPFIMFHYKSRKHAEKAQRILNHLKVFGENSEVILIGFEAKEKPSQLENEDLETLMSIHDAIVVMNKSKNQKIEGLTEKQLPQLMPTMPKNTVILRNFTQLLPIENISNLFVELGAQGKGVLMSDALYFTFKDASHLKLLQGFRFPDKKLSIEIKGPDEDNRLMDEEAKIAKSKINSHMAAIMDDIGKILKKKIDSEVNVYTFKTRLCQNNIGCKDGGLCTGYHSWSERRRCPLVYKHSTEEYCQKIIASGSCEAEDKCSKAHSTLEVLFHVKNFKRNICSSWQANGLCDKVGRICSSAHPGKPDMWYNDHWKDICIEGLEKTLDYLRGAIENLYVFLKTKCLRVLLITPSTELATLYISCVKDFARTCNQKVSELKGKFIEEDTTILITSVDALMSFWNGNETMHSKRMEMSQLKAIILDDVKGILKATPKHKQGILKEICSSVKRPLSDTTIPIPLDKESGYNCFDPRDPHRLQRSSTLQDDLPLPPLAADCCQLRPPPLMSLDLSMPLREASSCKNEVPMSSMLPPSTSQVVFSPLPIKKGINIAAITDKFVDLDIVDVTERLGLKSLKQIYADVDSDKTNKNVQSSMVHSSTSYRDEMSLQRMERSQGDRKPDMDTSRKTKEDTSRKTDKDTSRKTDKDTSRKTDKDTSRKIDKDTSRKTDKDIFKSSRNSHQSSSSSVKDEERIMARVRICDEYSVSKKDLQDEFHAELELYLETPEIHPNYEKQYAIFIDQYHKNYLEKQEVDHMDGLWKKFWKHLMKGYLKKEYSVRKKLLEEDFKRELADLECTYSLKRKSSVDGEHSSRDTYKSLSRGRSNDNEQLCQKRQYSKDSPRNKRPREDKGQKERNDCRDDAHKGKSQCSEIEKLHLRGMIKKEESEHSEEAPKLHLRGIIKKEESEHSEEETPSHDPRKNEDKVKPDYLTKNGMFLEKTIELLMEISPALGILCPTVEMLCKEIASCMGNEEEVRRLMQKTDTRVVINSVSFKAKTLSEACTPGSNKLKLEMASIQAEKLLNLYIS